MTKQFKVGQVWADKEGTRWTIKRIGKSICAECVGWKTWFDLSGVYCQPKESKYDLITLVKDTEDTVTNKLDEVRTNQLPPEPIPGQYYRTKDGFKLHFIGKGKYVYYYENGTGDSKYTFDRPYHYHKNCDHDYDIIAPWTEPLPAVEIKRWAIVRTMPYKGLWRGYVRSVGDNKKTLELDKQDDEEIVELVGTLPVRP
jgi:hypothetical protein